jgi:predicted transcriptional regulator
MNYSKYSSHKGYTKSTDDSAKVNRFLNATFGCCALFISATATPVTVSASDTVISHKRNSHFVIYTERDGKSKPSRDKSDIDVSVDQMANEIKGLFGLNISDLAKILNVSRPTVYKYLQGEGPTDPTLVTRIQHIYSLATEWNTITSKPISKELKRAYPKSKSLLELMTQQEINIDFLTSRVRELAALSETRSERLNISANDRALYQANLANIASSVG